MSSIDLNQVSDKELDVPSYYTRNKLREGVREFVDKIESDKDKRVEKAKSNFKNHIEGK